MACGCNRRTRAAAAGQTIAGYRVVLDETVYPSIDRAPFMSAADARAKIRELGGGTAYVEYNQAS